MDNRLNQILSLIQTSLVGVALLGLTILILWHIRLPVLLFIVIWLIFGGIFKESLRDTLKSFGILPRKQPQNH